MRIGAEIEQVGSRIELQIVDRDHQRRDAIRCRSIDGLAGCDDGADAAHASGPGRIQECRQTAGRPVLGPRLRRDLRAPVVDGRANRDIGACGNQKPGELGKVAGGSPHQRGLAAPALDGVDVRSVSDETLGDIE